MLSQSRRRSRSRRRSGSDESSRPKKKSRRRSGSRKRSSSDRSGRSKRRGGRRSASREKGRRSSDSASRSRSSSSSSSSSPECSLSRLWQRLQRGAEKLAKAKGKTIVSSNKEQKTNGAASRSISLSDELRNERRSGGSGLGRLNGDLQKRLDSGRRTASLRIAASMLESGAQVKEDQLQQLLEQAALRPGAMQFAMALWLVAACPGITLGVEPFLRGLGAMVQQRAPAQQIRLWLNLALPKASSVLRPLPENFDSEERAEAARELEEAMGIVTDDEETSGSRGSTPKTFICFTGCLVRPELNGRYQLNEGITSYHKPVYDKIVERQRNTGGQDSGRGNKGGKGKSRGVDSPAGSWADDGEDEGTVQDVIVVHYRKTRNCQEGWYFTRKTCGGEELAFNGRESRAPPVSGWFTVQKGSRVPDPLRIVDNTRNGNGAGSKTAMRVFEQIDIQRLRGRVTASDGSEPAAEYFGHFCALLHLEHLEELRQLRRRARRNPPEFDGVECVSIFDRKCFKKTDALGWEDPGSEMGSLILPTGTNFERLRLKKGDSVSLVESTGTLGRRGAYDAAPTGATLEGTIADFRPAKGREPAQMIVKVRGAWPDNAMTVPWRVDRGANSTLYERQLQALLSLVVKPRSRICELVVAARVGAVDAWVAKWRGAKGGGDCTAGMSAPSSKDRARDQMLSRKLARAEPPGTDARKLREAMDEVERLTQLNASQRAAVKASMQQTCTVVQGPPGTGKTHVSVEILKMWARTLRLSPLLATSDSNVAVDNIVMGLQAQGVRVLRVGRPEKVNMSIEEFTLENAVEREIARAEAEAEEAAKKNRSSSSSRDRSRSPSKHSDAEWEAWYDNKGKGKGKGKDKGKGKGKGKGITPKMRFEMQMKVLRSAEVICCTSISAGGDFLSRFSFAGILVDEAAQATELSAVVPVILRGTQRLVLVGDQCQLPPTVQSSEAEARGLSVSLYSRMVDGGGLTPHLLDTQYRSHPLLAAFSARAFYHGRLQSGISAAARPPPAGPRWPRRDVPLAFVEVECDEQQDGDSKMNTGEADAVVSLLRDVLAKGELKVTDVGVVTPYVAQVRLLRRVARSVVPHGTDPMLLEIASVDNFQGREKELIIFSAVRSNRSGAVGFLADWRRLNVMITRARRGLVVCGNSRTLQSSEHWKAWLEFFKCVAAGEPLPRTPSPVRRRRAAEIKAEEERMKAEAKEAEAEASANAARERDRERERKRGPSRSRRSSPARSRPSPARTRSSPARSRTAQTQRSVNGGRSTAGAARDTRPMSMRLADSAEETFGGDIGVGIETSGVDAETVWEDNLPASPRSKSPSKPVDTDAAKSSALDALARAWASSKASMCAPRADESSSEIDLNYDET